MGEFDGRTAIVTGRGGEIDSAVAVRLARDGARVLVVDLDREGVDRAVAQITKAGGEARDFTADVTDAAAVAAYAQAGAELGDGEIDLFVNNAGIEGPVAPIEEYPHDAFERVMSVNVRGVFLGLKHVLPLMPRGGAVVNTASTAGIIGAAGLVAYIASKHAVIGITKTAALEMAERGIRVQRDLPGPGRGAHDDVARGRAGRRRGARCLS
jgi:NAD(P)-dependent dehydrogenase (short-subunit alcohol dehydrogenase family)